MRALFKPTTTTPTHLLSLAVAADEAKPDLQRDSAQWEQMGPRVQCNLGVSHDTEALKLGLACCPPPLPHRALRALLDRSCYFNLTQSDGGVILKRSIPAQICQLFILLVIIKNKLTDLCGN